MKYISPLLKAFIASRQPDSISISADQVKALINEKPLGNLIITDHPILGSILVNRFPLRHGGDDGRIRVSLPVSIKWVPIIRSNEVRFIFSCPYQNNSAEEHVIRQIIRTLAGQSPTYQEKSFVPDETILLWQYLDVLIAGFESERDTYFFPKIMELGGVKS